MVSSGAKNSDSATKFSGKSVLPPIRGSVFPEVRVCMEEQDFHISIIKGKKKVSHLLIETAIQLKAMEQYFAVYRALQVALPFDSMGKIQ